MRGALHNGRVAFRFITRFGRDDADSVLPSRVYPPGSPLRAPGAVGSGRCHQCGPEAGERTRCRRESESEPEFTVKVPVNVVLVNLTVTDKAGRPVKDLTAADFKLFEDGKRQRIQSFEIESGQPAVSPEPANPAGADATERPALQPLQSSEGEPGKLISFFVDDLTERSPQFFSWAISALKEFVAEEMGPKDRVGVFSASRGVRIPFSGNRKFLRGEIQELNVGKLDLAHPYRGERLKGPDPNEVSLTDLQAIRIVEGGHVGEVDLRIRAKAQRQYEETQAAVHRLLAGLAIHLRYLQHFKASKALVLLSEGFVLGRRMRWSWTRWLNRALKSRVSFNVVDIRGCIPLDLIQVAMSPLWSRDLLAVVCRPGTLGPVSGSDLSESPTGESDRRNRGGPIFVTAMIL